MKLFQHNVQSIELCTRYTSNSGQRTIRITSTEWTKDERHFDVVELTMFGNTEALETLPHSADFKDHSPEPAHPLSSAQVAEIEAQAEASELPDIGAVRLPDASEIF